MTWLRWLRPRCAICGERPRLMRVHVWFDHGDVGDR